MENHYEPPAIALKSRFSQRVINLPFLRRLAKNYSSGGYFFLPWLVIRRLRIALKKAKQEALILAKTESINLFANNKEMGFFNPTKNADYLRLDEVSGMLHWPELLEDSERQNGFGELLRLLNLYAVKQIHAEGELSRCWVLLAAKNCDQLLKHGYENFKRTIAHNYFNFLVQKDDPQLRAAEQILPSTLRERCEALSKTVKREPGFQAKDFASYCYFIFLLWEYAKKIDVHHHLERLEEPKEGNPIVVEADGKSMSQDLANSLIEYYAVDTVAPFEKIKTVLEIGGGYGRNAHVILSLNPSVRMILVDILPALYLAQRYLSSVFRDRKIFKVLDFQDFEEVREEFEKASLIFLMPDQLKLLPENYVDLTMNISSFGEMNVDQIRWYFDQIDRVTAGHFYTKQWKESKNPFDSLVLKKADYPDREHWKTLYSRDCVIQREFLKPSLK